MAGTESRVQEPMSGSGGIPESRVQGPKSGSGGIPGSEVQKPKPSQALFANSLGRGTLSGASCLSKDSHEMQKSGPKGSIGVSCALCTAIAICTPHLNRGWILKIYGFAPDTWAQAPSKRGKFTLIVRSRTPGWITAMGPLTIVTLQPQIMARGFFAWSWRAGSEGG